MFFKTFGVNEVFAVSPDLHSLILVDQRFANWASVGSYMSIGIVNRDWNEVAEQISVYFVLRFPVSWR